MMRCNPTLGTFVVCVLFSLSLLGASCSVPVGDNSNTSTEDNSNANENVQLGSGMITPAEGGVITSEDSKLRLDFPAGVVGEDTEFTIELDEDGFYDVTPSMTFDTPITMTFTFDDTDLQAAIANDEDALDSNGDPLDPETTFGLGLVTLDNDFIDGATTTRDLDGVVSVTAEVDHFTKIKVPYGVVFTLLNPNGGLGDKFAVGESFVLRFITIGRRIPPKLKLKDDQDNEVEWIVTSLIYDNLKLKDPSNSNITLDDSKTQTKNIEMIASSLVNDEHLVNYTCAAVGKALLNGTWNFTLTLSQFAGPTRTISGFYESGRQEECVAADNSNVNDNSGVDVMVEALALESIVPPLAIGSLIPTSCITGGSRGSKEEEGCDCDHVHGTIAISGFGSYDDTDTTGCGHGCIVMARPDELAITCN